MRINNKKLDMVFLVLLILLIIGLPIAIGFYNQQVWKEKIPPNAKVFTLTGNSRHGWILGEVRAQDIISLGHKDDHLKKPVITVSKGDVVVLKLRSSDVIHGFSLKDEGIFVTDGIQPGKTKLVSFKADKAGTFTFSCNAICGENHQNMQGILIVRI
ncbi:MAG: cupredoxin domain-containing protein [Desulfobacterales bacterium]